MARFNLDNYTEVKDRIPLFLAEHPDGRIVTDVVHLDFSASPPVCVIQASLYRNHEDTSPMATGLAYERETGAVNRTSFVENCETSAIGRALANANFAGSGPRPSREEMEKVNRVNEEVELLIDEVLELARKTTDKAANKAARQAIEQGDPTRLRAAIEYLSTHTEGEAA